MGTGLALKGFGFGDVFPKSLRSGDEWQILNSFLSSSRFINLNGFIWALSSFMHCLRTCCLLDRDTAGVYTAQWIYLQLFVIVHVYLCTVNNAFAIWLHSADEYVNCIVYSAIIWQKDATYIHSFLLLT